eukprot:GHVN01086367.1.p1 GENE.GHVN01086367.1~~GHVN01086367.1.p1  ORF type:complete len:194 (-),score=7.51 GHVN01086367.1:226-807(-)
MAVQRMEDQLARAKRETSVLRAVTLCNLKVHAGWHELEQVSNIRDLGKRYVRRGKFDPQADHAIRSANYRFFEFRERFIVGTPDVVRRYHLLRIRPVLEYNIAVWGPARVDQMNALEDVQKKVLYLITSYRRLSYDDKLQCLMLQSMRERREQCHLVQIYMIVNLYSPIQNMWQFSQGKFSLRNIHEIERTVR